MSKGPFLPLFIGTIGVNLLSVVIGSIVGDKQKHKILRQLKIDEHTHHKLKFKKKGNMWFLCLCKVHFSH